MENKETTVCRAVGAATNYNRIDNYITEAQEREKLHADFIKNLVFWYRFKDVCNEFKITNILESLSKLNEDQIRFSEDGYLIINEFGFKVLRELYKTRILVL